jgi:predicted CopG family antitoxin
MVTTIQISEKLLAELKKLKFYEKESYEDVILDLIEDSRELSREARETLKQAEVDYREGRVRTLEALEDELDL